MFNLFKKKNEKIYFQIREFEKRLNQAIVPLLEKPQKPILANAALIGMATNIALYFVAVRNSSFFQENAKFFLYEIGMTFGEAVEKMTRGKVKDKEAASSLIMAMNETEAKYTAALDKSATHPQEALDGCVQTFLDSAEGWEFKGEIERSMAVIKLSEEIQILMDKFRLIL